MFSKANDFWILAHVFRGPKVLNPSSCFQRPRIFLDLGSCFQRTKAFFGLRIMFLKDQTFWILAHVFRGLGFLDIGSCF